MIEFLVFLGWTSIIILFAYRFVYYMTEGHWKRVYQHDCGYVNKQFTHICPMCGEVGKWTEKVGKPNLFYGWKIKEIK